MKNKTSFEQHIKENKSLDWCDLAYKIIQLEDELFNLSEFLDEKEKNTYLQIIDDCESEKNFRLNKMFNHSKYIQKQAENTMFSDEEN